MFDRPYHCHQPRSLLDLCELVECAPWLSILAGPVLRPWHTDLRLRIDDHIPAYCTILHDDAESCITARLGKLLSLSLSNTYKTVSLPIFRSTHTSKSAVSTWQTTSRQPNKQATHPPLVRYWAMRHLPIAYSTSITKVGLKPVPSYLTRTRRRSSTGSTSKPAGSSSDQGLT